MVSLNFSGVLFGNLSAIFSAFFCARLVYRDAPYYTLLEQNKLMWIYNRFIVVVKQFSEKYISIYTQYLNTLMFT